MEEKKSLPRWKPANTHYVYVLKDPTIRGNNEVFYVGRTKHLLDRYNAHVRGDDSGSAKDERIRHITRGGMLPIMETVYQASSEKEAIFREAWYINYYQASGVLLTNATLDLNNNGHHGRYAYLLEHAEKSVTKYPFRWLRRWLLNRKLTALEKVNL